MDELNAASRLRRPRLDTATVAAVVLGAAVVTWILTIREMDGMDAGPGTALGGLAWYVGAWVTMMAAMMLPSALPMVLVFSKVSRDRERHGGAYAPTWVFVCGYLVAWTGYGLAAYGLYRLVTWIDPGFLRWDRQGPVVAGVAIALAGLYELTPPKNLCLKHCRSPLHVVLHGFRKGVLGGLRMGIEHGAWCVGCCWGLMLLLFALGVMSVLWMAVIAGLVFVEKVLPRGPWMARTVGVLIVAAGIWVAAAPGSVPGLTEPGTRPMGDMPGMQMSDAPAGTAPAAGTTTDDMAGMDMSGDDDMAGMDMSGSGTGG